MYRCVCVCVYVCVFVLVGIYSGCIFKYDFIVYTIHSKFHVVYVLIILYVKVRFPSYII